MPSGPPLAALIRQMTPDSETVPDDELLDRYARSRDQSAFELLVWRHGAMVWGVCRRILAPDRDAAEDACQAAFVALASHASRVRHRQAIAAWLHRVAVRAALDVLAARRATESLSNEIPDLADHQPGPDEIAANREVQSFLDAGLNRLPDMLRIPFVMCELEGRSNAEAAATLGCPVGTVESRLTRARRRLRGWLVARGVTPAVLGAASAVPDSVRASMIRAGTLRDAIHPAIRALADRAVRSALGAKLGTTVALAMVLAATVAGFGLPTSGLPDSPGSDNPLPQPNDKVKPVTAGRVDAEGVPLPPGVVARLGSSRLRHGNAVFDIAFSPDRTRIASCAADQTVRVWDGKTGRQICLTRWTDGRLACVRYTADGKTLIVAGNEDKKPPAIWQIDPTTGAVLARRKLSLAQEYVGYNLSPDGTRIAVCDTVAKAVRVFDTTADRELWRAEVSDIAWFDPAFALDGRTLAVVARKRIHLFDSAGKPAGTLVFDGDPDAYLTNVALSPDGSRVAACWSVRGFHLAVWNRTTGQIVWSRQTEPVSNAPQAFSPDGKWLVRVGITSEGQRGAMLMDASDGTEKAVFPLWEMPGCARFRSDGVVTVGGQWGTIRQFDPANGKPLTPSPDPPDGVELRGFSADGRTLFGWSEEWYAWDVATGQQRRLGMKIDRYDAVSPDGTRVARLAGEKDTARLEICDVKTGKIIHTHRGPEFDDVSPWYSFTPDGKGVIGNLVDGTTRVWAVDTGKELIRIAKEPGQPGPYAISADGRVFAAIDHMGPDQAHSIRVWNLRTGRELAKFEEKAAHGVSISGDGHRIAAAVCIVGTAEQQERFPNPPRVTVWDVASGKILARVPQGGKCGSVELSPDGRTIAVRTWIGGLVSPVLRVYEVASGSERLVFHHDGRLLGFTFSPNGKLLAASSAEAPVYLWDMTGDLNGLATWNPADANKVWDDLSSGDAAKAFTAIRRLRGNPTPALAFLKDRVKPPTAPNADALKGLFADLAAEDFEVREKAVETLGGYDDAVRPAMERELNQSQSPEARLRLKKLIDRLNGPTPIRLRLIRAVEAVEGMGTAEADTLLATWAKEPAGSALATEATIALARRRKGGSEK